MPRSLRRFVPPLLSLLLATSAYAEAPRLAPALGRLALTAPDSILPAWVYFTDRAGAERDPAAVAAARAALTARALDRRARRGTLRDVDASDLPVHEAYVRALVARGARLRGTSRWLDAASVDLPARLAAEIARWPFVARVTPVERGMPIRPVGPGEPVAARSSAGRDAASPARVATEPGDPAYYGGSLKQLQMMQVPALHAQGLTGAGVLVCMLDAGFHLTHRAFAGLQVVATRDFVHGDLNVDDQPGQDSAGTSLHGTATLACVGGHLPGTYSGGAFGASFALGKTENVLSETPVEMDYWQFGAEWADSLGADVISSSLGYNQFDAPYPSYTYADMDGRTTVVTKAAVAAMRRGITVVNAAGNEGASGWFYIIAPGDADSIVTSGAVDSLNVVASFSSHGPTSDGRTKPDVTAMGRSVLTIPYTNDSTYVRFSGTSFSTPLTAGLVALLLEAHPAWRPIDVVDALHATALNHASPNNNIGWGLVQGLAAESWSPVTAVPPAPRAPELALAVSPNPARAGAPLSIRFTLPAGASSATLDVIDLAGRRRAPLFAGGVAAAASGDARTIEWRGDDAAGRRLAAGIYWVRLAVAGAKGPETITRRIALLP